MMRASSTASRKSTRSTAASAVSSTRARLATKVHEQVMDKLAAASPDGGVPSHVSDALRQDIDKLMAGGNVTARQITALTTKYKGEVRRPAAAGGGHAARNGPAAHRGTAALTAENLKRQHAVHGEAAVEPPSVVPASSRSAKSKSTAREAQYSARSAASPARMPRSRAR